MVLKYAWRGFIRRRTRTILAVAGIALCVALLVTVLSISSAVENAVSNSLETAGADMVIQRRVPKCSYSEVKLPLHLGAIPQDVVKNINEIDQVKAVSGVLVLWAFWKGHPTVVAGIDPTKKTIGPVRIGENKAGEGSGKSSKEDKKTCCAITDGRYLVRYDTYQAMLTEQYAKAVGAKVGDTIHLGPRHTFKVVGLVDLSKSAKIAEAEAFIPLKTAQKMYDRGPVVDTIFVALKGGRNIPLVSAVVEHWINRKEISITTARNVDAATSAVATVTRKSMLGVSVLVLFFGLMLIIRNALSSVADRLSEVGLMRAIGWRRTDVSRLFVLEEVFGGVIGGVIGCLGGWVLAIGYSDVAHLKLPAALSSFPPCSSTPPPLALPLATTPSLAVFVIGLVIALLIGSVAGLAASHRAARLDPADALRRL